MRYILCLFIIIGLSSCKDKAYEYEKEFLEKYVDGKRALSYELTDHFPSHLKADKQLSISYPAGAYANGMANMIFSHKVDSTDFNTVTRKLKLSKIKTYQPTDSIFIIIGDSLDYSKKISGIPIPSFQSYERDFGLNSKYLTDNHNLYVLEYKPGQYMDKEYLTSKNKLPEKWKNGFSRGIAINESQRELIYWTCVW
tara:strand:+ start:80 stop:670 length:591 start_codon:yes stop_codon:yes gene_type:complete